MKTAILCSHYFHVAELREAIRSNYTIEERLQDLIEYQHKLVKYYFRATCVAMRKGQDIKPAWQRHEVAFARLRMLRTYLYKLRECKDLSQPA